MFFPEQVRARRTRRRRATAAAQALSRSALAFTSAGVLLRKSPYAQLGELDAIERIVREQATRDAIAPSC